MPLGDAWTTVFSLLAQYMLNLKRIENWALGVALDVVFIVIYVSQGLYFTAGSFVIYLIVCVLGYRQWSRELDYKVWERNAHRSEFLLPNGLYHLAGMQIVAEDQVVADCCLYRERSPLDFSDEDMSLLLLLQRHASLACRNSLLYANAAGASDILAAACQVSTQGVIILDSRLRVQYRNTAATLIAEQYQRYAGPGVSLVSILAELIAHHRAVEPRERIKSPCRVGRLSLRQRVLEYRIVAVSSSPGEARYAVYLQWADAVGQARRRPFGLSRREYEIAQLVVRGLANAEIADTLHISHNTVKTHIKHLMEKTGTHTRTEFTYILLRHLRDQVGRDADLVSPDHPDAASGM